MSYLRIARQVPDYDTSALAALLGKKIQVKEHENRNGQRGIVQGYRTTHFRCFLAKLHDETVWLLPQEIEVLP